MSNNLNDRNAFINNKSNEANALIESVKKGIPDFLNPERFKVFLSLFSSFHRYPYINVLLLAMQYPTASHVAGFDTWQRACLDVWKDSKRQVLKDDAKGKGIRLVAPYTHTMDVTSRKLINYIVSVYDVSQTNELPHMEQDPEYVVHPNLEHLISAVRAHSVYTVEMAGRENIFISRGLDGYCDHEKKMIFIDENLSRQEHLSVLVREVAISKIKLMGYKDKELNHLITESITYIFNTHFGNCFEFAVSGFEFISNYKDVSVDRIANSLFIVQRIINKMIVDVEKTLEEYDSFEAFSDFNEEALLPPELEEVFLGDYV